MGEVRAPTRATLAADFPLENLVDERGAAEDEAAIDLHQVGAGIAHPGVVVHTYHALYTDDRQVTANQRPQA